MQKSIFILLFSIFCFQSINFGQPSLGTAILFPTDLGKEKILQPLRENIINYLKPLAEKEGYVVYDWTVNAKSPLVINPTINTPEKPCDKVVYLSFENDGQQEFNAIFAVSLKVEMNMDGKTIKSVNYPLSIKPNITIKVIDAGTSVVESIIRFPLYSGYAHTGSLEIKDWNKFFTTNPKTVQRDTPKVYEEAVRKIEAKYAVQINQKYKEVLLKCDPFLPRLTNMIEHQYAAKSFAVDPQPEADGRVKKITFTGGTEDGIIPDTYFHVLEEKTVQNQTYYDIIADYRVSSVDGSKSTAESMLSGAKDVGEALKNGKQLLLTPYYIELVTNKLNFKDNIPAVPVSIKKKCIFCATQAEVNVINSPTLQLVERNAPELRYFANLMKKEDFIDYSLEDLQGKMIGSQILITFENKMLNAVNVSTNNQLVAETNRNRTELTYADLSIILDKHNSAMYYIEMLSVMDEKKEKIKSVLAKSTVGFDPSLFAKSNIEFFTLEKEVVDGQEYSRKNVLALGKIEKRFSISLAEVEITDGEKELFRARAENKKILLGYNNE